MLEKTLQNYLATLNIKTYSIITINPLNEAKIISNMPHAWEVEFIRRKLHIHSNIVQCAKERITPFFWNSEESNNEDIRHLSEKYKIHTGITFIVKIQQVTILFTIYFEENNKEIIDIFSGNKEHILYEILSIFEKHYKIEPPCKFTKREHEVANLLKTGKTYGEIALILGICERTVRFHINNILIKLDVTSVKYAIFKATSEGLI
ncbi:MULTISPECIES: helix-turn-helix transcriptional regulator [Citrobacter freundii complex]|uniref:helix-turn-helix transcriptional regulator n=1 Tax=Citrobacter freundii complex TaxID=1344959 RepID=UPI0007615210|nr:LuxR family transcriptional regulator [Citrobacter portucalensis]MDT7481254.1 LuxR C-terminal-related transcriptional regulator [Citrobacter portucalensis]MDX7129154.1 LuxR C-terminal-related transcriptional regulator [Citrobacter portucalensis]WIJ57192.1 LuxR family transcriptional regulator [Citrobacter portucalensis]WOU42927.1 LuxR C-terminal-related transcriptional regulator [Citrobacter portucalensis]